ncbi:type IV toxin-antitoxin system AbiEi family antitoxin domain-containing protein [Janibacter sp. G1551]|uniref:type IV toxin-antitoxin system AbiEi family antitoxin domain-containing protein n=1 Tax=Janibacter sp. G1551 TaxID=3420440 RepID=UPI003CFD5303
MSPDLDAVPAELLALSATQHGLFTTRQAARSGVGRAGLRSLLDHSHVARVCRGAYVVGGRLPERAIERHLLLARAGLLLYPDAGLVGVSRLAEAGIQIWGATLDRALLCRPVTSEVLTNSFRVRPPSMQIGRGAHAQSLAGALVQLALDNGMSAGVVSADHALHEGRVTRSELERCVREVRGWPRSSRAMAMLDFVDGRSESPGESRLRIVAATVGLDLIPQVEIRDDLGRLVARADFRVRGTKVLLEFDGMVKYREGGPAALVAEKKREESVRRLGWRLVRVTWPDLEAPTWLIGTLRELVEVQRYADARREGRVPGAAQPASPQLRSVTRHANPGNAADIG